MPYLDFETDFARRIMDRTTSMLAYWDRDLRCRYANKAYHMWFGKSGDQLVGTKIDALLGPHIFKLNEPYIRAALAGQPQVFERMIPGPDGLIRHSLARYHPDIVDGAVVGFVVEVSDVGVLKKLEAALHAEVAMKCHALAELDKKDAALEAAQAVGRMGSWEWEIESGIMTWSQGLYRLFGQDPARLPPQYADQAKLYAPASWTRLQNAVEMARNEGRPYVLDLEYHRPDGGTGWLEARGEVERDCNGAIVTLHGTAHDITEIHAFLEALRYHTSHLEQALDAARLGIWCWDLDSDLLRWENPRMRDIIGIGQGDPDVVGGQAFFNERLHPDDRPAFREALARYAQGGAAQFEFSGRLHGQAAGQWMWIECAGRAAEPDSGRRTLIGTVMDVSEHVGAREALQRSLAELRQSDDRKSAFLYSLAHELRNGISPLVAGMQLLKKRLADTGSERIEAIMARQIGHLTRLVDDIYDLRRVYKGEVELRLAKASFKAVVEGAVDTVVPSITQMGHSLCVDLPAEDVLVLGDEVRLTQVVVNLLSNACKFTPRQGSIQVALKVSADDQAVLTIRDNGIGMRADACGTIFDLYAQIEQDDPRYATGLGIGLFLVKQLVEGHGGTVTATSAGLGKGSTVGE